MVSAGSVLFYVPSDIKPHVQIRRWLRGYDRKSYASLAEGWIQMLEKMNDPGFVKKFVRVIIDDHDTTGENHSYGNTNDQTRSVVANGSFEEILVAGSHTFIDRYLPLSMTLRR